MKTAWSVDETCLPDLPAAGDPTYAAALAARQAAESLAVQILWHLSGEQFGIYDVIARPCVPTQPWWTQRLDSSYGGGYVVAWDGGNWLNVPCGCTMNWCQLTGPGAVHLPGPAREVVEVKVHDTVLDPDEYVLEGNVLFRVGTHHVWPRQDLSRPLGDYGTWGVEYLRGTPVPNGVDRLTGLLANELVSLCVGGKCRLPRNAVSVNRQGMSFVLDATPILNAGRTGLFEVDSWLAAVNPYHLVATPSVI